MHVLLRCNSQRKLYNVATFNKSNSILEASKYDPVVLVRLSGVSDLMSAKGKYLNTWYQRFVRRTSKTHKSAN
ncbi:hypothetical protein E2C01_078843 [Portunus trituberculatus]|uniref:Uncharacterized protein n=1 Tax=Portunus trituberculatus TaxID=210409 RepID=A0A5B7IR72_PORTR|nr:hypothetical protein [Portunus trituberculatus]